MTRSPGGLPGHPEPEPVPTPEPDPPMPIPPPEPVPPPEPPHEEHSTMRSPADRPTVQLSAERPAGAAADRPDDFIDAPPAEEVAWPPFGAFDDEREKPTQLIHPGDQQVTAWQPAQPWHAQHEKPGEWRTTPPEHLAYQHSPPADIQEQPTALMHPAQPEPWQVPLKPDADDRRRRTGLWISVALTAALLLCGGGAFSAYALLRDTGGGGAPDPATAVNEFMTAVYTRQDASAANDLVCREARDADRLAIRVSQIKDLAKEYDGPAFRWSEPAVSARTDERATVSVQLTLTTDDEKTADQQLTFTTVRKSGWLVCEIAG